MHRLLDELIDQMVSRGVHYEDACREFEKRFISKVLTGSDNNLTRASDTLGVHRNTLARKIKELKIKA